MLKPKTYDIMLRALEEGVRAGMSTYTGKIYASERDKDELSSVFRCSEWDGFYADESLANDVVDALLSAVLEVFKIETPQDDESY